MRTITRDELLESGLLYQDEDAGIQIRMGIDSSASMMVLGLQSITMPTGDTLVFTVLNRRDIQ